MNWRERLRSLAAGDRDAERSADDDTRLVVQEAPERSYEATVPHGMKIAAAWSWRFLLVVAAIAVLIFVVGQLDLVVIPVAIALLLAALLQPAAAWLIRRRFPSALAAAIVLLGGLIVVVGVITLVVQQFIQGLPELTSQVTAGLDQIRSWLVTGPLSLSQTQIDAAVDQAQDLLSNNQDVLTSGALSTAVTIGHLLTGLLLVLFSLFFFLREGRRIWHWVVGLSPARARRDLENAGLRAWSTLVSYVRATVLVAFVDAVGIGGWIAILGVPLALPLSALVFLAAFIPLVGATVSGIVAVVVALVANGFLTALLVLIGVIVVQQLEGHVLQPLLLGRAVKVHPLAVVLSIAAGVVLAGIIGALVAVPLVASLNAAIIYLARGRRRAAAVAEQRVAEEREEGEEAFGGLPARPDRTDAPDGTDQPDSAGERDRLRSESVPFPADVVMDPDPDPEAHPEAHLEPEDPRPGSS